MSNYIEVIAIVEGKTEQIFIESILAPYLGFKDIFMSATQATKPGQKGGDIRFSRVKRDIEIHLKQRPDTYITTFMDYYGIKEWTGIDLLPSQASPEQIAAIINKETKSQIVSLFSELQAERRFIPFIAVHEFEALLFSDVKILAEKLGKNESEIVKIISECGSPEAINNSQQTAPSKRLNALASGGGFLKTTMGITIAKEIGIEKIREKCPPFN